MRAQFSPPTVVKSVATLIISSEFNLHSLMLDATSQRSLLFEMGLPRCHLGRCSTSTQVQYVPAKVYLLAMGSLARHVPS